MYIRILIVVLVVAATLIAMVAARPAGFRVTRTASVGGPSAEVFAQVNELHNWEAWSPWAELDPAAMTVYDGPPGGVGPVSAGPATPESARGISPSRRAARTSWCGSGWISRNRSKQPTTPSSASSLTAGKRW